MSLKRDPSDNESSSCFVSRRIFYYNFTVSSTKGLQNVLFQKLLQQFPFHCCNIGKRLLFTLVKISNHDGYSKFWHKKDPHNYNCAPGNKNKQ